MSVTRTQKKKKKSSTPRGIGRYFDDIETGGGEFQDGKKQEKANDGF
jgi:hypothetical protein